MKNTPLHKETQLMMHMLKARCGSRNGRDPNHALQILVALVYNILPEHQNTILFATQRLTYNNVHNVAS